MAFTVTLCAELDAGTNKRPITVEDCVSTRRIVMEETKLSPKGDLVAYLVKSPSVRQNLNIFELYVRRLDQGEGRTNGRLLFSGAEARELKWLPNDQDLLCLIKEDGGKTRLIRLNVATGRKSTVIEYRGIEDYSTDAAGQKVVFSV